MWLSSSFTRLAEVLSESPQGCRATRVQDVLSQKTDVQNNEKQVQCNPRLDTSKLFFIALNWIKEMAVHLADGRHHPIMQSAPEVLNKKWLLIRV
jgi:hypothetical protein